MASDKKLRKQRAVDERSQRAAANPQAKSARDTNRKLNDLARESLKIKRAGRPDPLA